MKLNESQRRAVEKIYGPCILLAGAGTGKTKTLTCKMVEIITMGYAKPDEILCLTFSNAAAETLKERVVDAIENVYQKHINEWKEKWCQNHSENEWDAFKKQIPEMILKTPEISTFHKFSSDMLTDSFKDLSSDLLADLTGEEKSGTDLFGCEKNRVLHPPFQIIEQNDSKFLLYKSYRADKHIVSNITNSIAQAKERGISKEDIRNFIKKEKEYIFSQYGIKDEQELQYAYSKANTPNKDNPQSKKTNDEDFLIDYKEFDRYRMLLQAWEMYDSYKNGLNCLDFGDLNNMAVQILNDRTVRNRYANRYKFVIVDEFQDTNRLQLEIIKKIAPHGNVTIVGDPNQSVYGFRGAYKRSFEDFIHEYGIKDEEIIRLEMNYRSPDEILDRASDLIRNNYEDPDDCIRLKNFQDRRGEKVNVVRLCDVKKEAEFIADEIENEIYEKNTPPEKICVLYRSHKHSVFVEDELRRRNIPYTTSTKNNLLAKGEVRTALAYMAVLSEALEPNGWSENAVWTLLCYQTGLTYQDRTIIAQYCHKNKTTPKSFLFENNEKSNLSKSGRLEIEKLQKRMQMLLSKTNMAVSDILLEIYDISGLSRAFSGDRSKKNKEGMTNLREFYEKVKQVENMYKFTLPKVVDYFEKSESLGIDITYQKEDIKNSVQLKTIHSAKGEEYDVVFLIRMNQNEFPVAPHMHNRKDHYLPSYLYPEFKFEIDNIAKENDIDYEKEGNRLFRNPEIRDRVRQIRENFGLLEERRLCYVALTRAQKRLFLTFTNQKKAKPSQFLNEIDYKNTCNYMEMDKTSDSFDQTGYSSMKNYDFVVKNAEKTALKEFFAPDLSLDGLIGKMIAYYAALQNVRVDCARYGVEHMQPLTDNILKEIKNKTDQMNHTMPLDFNLGPAKLMEYSKCPKKFEFKHIYRLPEKSDVLEEFDKPIQSGPEFGNFIHKVLEIGVLEKQDLNGIMNAAYCLSESEFPNIDMQAAREAIEVFWARNEAKLKNAVHIETEFSIKLEIDGISYSGRIDRIDYLPDRTVEVIDYKTNSNPIKPYERNLQLGFYALALKEKDIEASRLTLDTLRLKTSEELEKKYIEKENKVVYTRPNLREHLCLSEVECEIKRLTQSIRHDMATRFKPTPSYNSCNYCPYKIFCPAWEEDDFGISYFDVCEREKQMK